MGEELKLSRRNGTWRCAAGLAQSESIKPVSSFNSSSSNNNNNNDNNIQNLYSALYNL